MKGFDIEVEVEAAKAPAAEDEDYDVPSRRRPRNFQNAVRVNPLVIRIYLWCTLFTCELYSRATWGRGRARPPSWLYPQSPSQDFFLVSSISTASLPHFLSLFLLKHTGALPGSVAVSAGGHFAVWLHDAAALRPPGLRTGGGGGGGEGPDGPQS